MPHYVNLSLFCSRVATYARWHQVRETGLNSNLKWIKLHPKQFLGAFPGCFYCCTCLFVVSDVDMMWEEGESMLVRKRRRRRQSNVKGKKVQSNKLFILIYFQRDIYKTTTTTMMMTMRTEKCIAKKETFCYEVFA